LWGFVVVHYGDLPETIPVHFDAAGKADGFGPKAMLFIMPVLNTLLIVLLAFLARKPHLLNYPVAITEANAGVHYANGVAVLNLLQLSISVLFSLITWQTSRLALGQSDGLGAWMLPFVLLSVFLPISLFFLRSMRKG
jgi:hypothetical protein